MSESFKPENHLMKVGGKDYLQVAWRIVWMREAHPDWGIQTAPVKLEVDANGGGFAIFHAQITDETGRVIAEATKFENRQGFPDFIEKAETGAIGRALALCGYGTQFVGDELEEGQRLADSPVARQAVPTPIRPPATRRPTDEAGQILEEARAMQPLIEAARTVRAQEAARPPNVAPFANSAPKGCNIAMVTEFLKEHGFAATSYGAAIKEVNDWIRGTFPGQPLATGTGDWDAARNEHKMWPSDLYNAASHYFALCEEPGESAVTVAAGGIHVNDDESIPF